MKVYAKIGVNVHDRIENMRQIKIFNRDYELFLSNFKGNNPK